MSTRKILIAGATGYLGRYVVIESKKRGFFVKALVRSPEKLHDVVKFVDDVVVAEATRPEQLIGVCSEIDVVFSSIGITRQRGGPGFMDVDYLGNRNILSDALREGVKKFVFVSVLHPHLTEHLEIVGAKERFVRELESSGIDFALIRPTGFFSDIGEYLRMAARGRVFLIGDGSALINPIHGADVAEACLDAIENSRKEWEIGGPETLSHAEIAKSAFSCLNKKPRITRIPLWVINPLLASVRPFNKKLYTTLRFLTTVSSNDMVGFPIGNRTVRDFFLEIISKKSK